MLYNSDTLQGLEFDCNKQALLDRGTKPLTGSLVPSFSVNAAMMLAILFSLKTMELLQNGFATDF